MGCAGRYGPLKELTKIIKSWCYNWSLLVNGDIPTTERVHDPAISRRAEFIDNGCQPRPNVSTLHCLTPNRQIVADASP